MIRTLVIVRHGKPEKHAASGVDFDRELRPAGAEALREAFPVTFSLLRGKTPVIWSSPAVRARQTAEIVAAAVGLEPEAVQYHDSLYEQNVDAFLEELYDSRDECVVVVGHIPFAEMVPRRIARLDLDFNPGAACALTFDSKQPLPARLEWFVRGPEVRE